MTLVRCPGCRNLVSRESARCPVCGCSYTAAMTRLITKWAIVAILAIYFLERFVIHKLPMHGLLLKRLVTGILQT
jgi:hypothetical protein